MSLRKLFVACDSATKRKNMDACQRARLGLWEVVVDARLSDAQAALCALAAYQEDIECFVDEPREDSLNPHYAITVLDPLTGYPIGTDTSERLADMHHVHSIRRLHS